MGAGGEGNARGARAVDSSKGPERMGNLHYEQGGGSPF